MTTSLVQPVDATFALAVWRTNQRRCGRRELCRRVVVRESPATPRVFLGPARARSDSSKLQVMLTVMAMRLVLRLSWLERLLSERQVVLVRSPLQRGVVLQNSLTSANRTKPGDRR